MTRSRGNLALLAAFAVALAAAADPAPAETGEEAEAVSEPASRATYVHRIPLYDTEENKITPDSDPALPFSTRATCGDCHDYETISGGWHFSAPDPEAAPGRPAQPWIWVSRKAGVQLPLSYRPWPGTYRPEAVGLTPWRFVLRFGRHMPGGGPGEKFAGEPGDDPDARWPVSGKLEIDCLLCHGTDAAGDPIQWGLNIAEQNLMWAPAATSGLAQVRGSAREMPETYDPYMEPNAEAAAKGGPRVLYDKTRFDDEQKGFFDVDKPLASRCYFCHTNHPVGDGSPEKWERDEDVHLAAGLACADCHRHGLDHKISRGHEGEADECGRPAIATLTCRGCHLGHNLPNGIPTEGAGRLGAPVPRHEGFPIVHFEKLSCTACHSGPRPGQRAGRVQTSRAHALEFAGEHRGDDALPYIAQPVFVLQKNPRDGREEIAPHRMMWPAFWGRSDGEAVTPIPPDEVLDVAEDILEVEAGADESKVVPLISREQIFKTLAVLAAADPKAGEPVYVCGGKLYRRGPDGNLIASDHPAAAPYSWPLAHDVRPAALALGYGGECTDCHSMDAPFFFGKVAADGPADLGEPVTVSMYEFQNQDPVALVAWALSFQFRPFLKVVGFVSAGVIAAILILYGFRALAALLKWADREGSQG
ncbi:MAG TPA: hypothetical protein VFH53_06820 [Phycisphaerae bacterium]|nr:hypothetical protein [Phycisphaerae bacterium]